MRKILLFLIFVLLANTASLFAQTAIIPQVKPAENAVSPKLKVVIKGEVLDSMTNESIPYATLKIIFSNNPDKPVKLLTTDVSGKFEVELSAVGEYVLLAQYLGKATTKKEFSVTNVQKQINLGKIHMRDNKQLEEVQVVAFKPLVKVDLDKIAYSIEDDPDSKTNNVLDMIKKVPMITVDADEKIQLKGSESFKIHLDGKPSNLITNNPAQVLRSMPANTIKSIEVITDPGAKYDAEGVTGIINIITNKQPMGGYTGSVSGGLDLRGGYNAGTYLTLKYGKIGFTGNYNYNRRKNPGGNSSLYRETLDDDNYKYLNQNGTSSFNGNGQYGYGELSYEIDTLNLISMGFNGYGGETTNRSNALVEMKNVDQDLIYSYRQNGKNTNEYGSTNVNLDYQRSFKKKDELLTTSYRFSMEPNNSESETAIDSILNFKRRHQMASNDADSKEHTFQLDYTTPIAKIHTLEGGAKYIIRLNESSGDHSVFNYTTNQFEPSIELKREQFLHRQDILSAYLGYNVRYSKFGFKAGLRMEETKLKAEFPLNRDNNFENEYFNLVPSATFSYQVKQMQNLRFGYNLRIQRPSIWYLNPYVDNSNPKYISSGNPDLDVEKSHNFNLNYSVFQQKFNINASLSYNYINNSIQRITRIINDVSFTTFDNVGKSNQPGVYLSGNWNPNMKLRVFTNLSGSYTDIRATDDSGLKNSGFQGNGYIGIQYSLPHDFMLSFDGGGGSPRINLMGHSSSYFFSGFGINKYFWKKKLTISVNGTDVFSKYKTYGSENRTDEFYFKSDGQYLARNMRFSVTYRFGEMKQQIQKAKRGISNDDAKAGENGGNTGGGSGGGQ